MSQQSKREIIRRLHPRYLKASRQEKTKILDEFVALTNRHRKHAIRVLGKGVPEHPRERRGRKRKYKGDTVEALRVIWSAAGKICGKRLHPFIPNMIDQLERHNEILLNEDTRVQLLEISPATIDRLLKSFKTGRGKGLSTTKPGTLLKSSIAVRTSGEWDEDEPGFMEIDLVAHCGRTTAGAYLNTLTATDIATGWTECVPLIHRSQLAVKAALDCLRERLPFDLLGIDSDNDAVFINELLYKYCLEDEILFTRCRPYKKNDQAHVEQKNWSIVRRTVGYQRFESEEALQTLSAVYDDLRLFTNFFQPTFKLESKERIGAKVKKKYGIPQTPYQRLDSYGVMTGRGKMVLHQQYLQTNPVVIQKQIDENLRKLWNLKL